MWDSRDSAALQRDLDTIFKWEQNWQLRFNVDKCKVMHLGGDRNKKNSYTMNSVSLKETTEEKDLGIWINSTLKSSTHVAHAVSKANQLIGLIRRSFTYLDCQLMKQLYTTIVRPHFNCFGYRIVKGTRYQRG